MNELFNVKSLSKKCEKEYTKRFFPNNDVLSYADYSKEYNLTTVNYNDLENHEIWGMLYSMNRENPDELTVTFQDAAHTLIVGTTQVGKTWGHVMDSIYVQSAKKNKPCFMIADPKGEISENTTEILKKRGYKIFALNFKDTQYSNMWNPLLEIYDNWMEMNSIEANGDWVLAHKKSDIESRTSDLINQLVSSLGSTAVQNSKDPGWQQGALEILRGMIYLMLEDALNPYSGFKRENMNFMNMQRYYEILRNSVLSGSMTNTPLLKTTKLWHKKITDDSIRHMRAFFENAPTTTRSYLGCFENIMQEWFNPKIYSLANDNNVDLSNYEEQPFAIFLITRDYEKSDYFIAGLFIDWVYKEMLLKAEDNGGKLNREMFFILDEFANIPVINGFTNKISTSLSRRIIFQLYVQSYEQIEGNYGIADAGTIKGNCNVEIFLGSQSYKTKREFSEKCGTRRIKTLDASLSPDKKTIIEIPALSINSLENLKRGDAYVKCLNRPTSKSHFEMAYLCDELSHTKLPAKELGIQSIPYNDEIFVYKYLEHEDPMFVPDSRINKYKNKAAIFVDMDD